MWTSAMNVGMVESWFYVMDALLPIIKVHIFFTRSHCITELLSRLIPKGRVRQGVSEG
jgi:hypothetical protein